MGGWVGVRYGRIGRWVTGGMGGWPVCEVWADRWVEGEGKEGEYRV
jgi:hypothetical protein